MRLWHKALIEVLPKAMLVSQWRECIAIKRQWEKGTLKHRLVSYVMDYNKSYLSTYTNKVRIEMENRGIKHQYKYMIEIKNFSDNWYAMGFYEEHNDRYLKQCLYNLQEKADRGIITKEEWQKIEDKFGGVM